ncbi:hypothetical protein [Massilia sp. UBA6681]|uniref:hypothetical protein n=1 Tax=Massilia sp. UBA6681 TaxID=1946839 RepID=UPI0025C24BC1|nr:hypothetical protein [Massilia sp. UBA6681]
MRMKFDRTIALNIIWLAGLFVAWGFVAGQAGSPVPYNWTRLARIAHALELSFLVSLVLLMLAPAASIAARRGKPWAVAYPVVLLLGCVATLGFSLYQLAHMPPKPVFARSDPPHRCSRWGEPVPALDAVGSPVRRGDLVILWSSPGAEGPEPDTDKQAFQRGVWNGRIVMVTGFARGGALRVLPTDTDMGSAEPHFCVWPDKVARMPMP